MTWPSVVLGEIISPAKVQRAGESALPVLSMTMHDGLIDQAGKFKKQVASADKSQYKVITQDQLVVGFPIDEGVLAFQSLYDRAIVSPAYGVWDVDLERVDKRYLQRYLRSPFAIAYYSAKLQGTTARRRSLPNPVFLAHNIPLPPLPEQRRIAAILDHADTLGSKQRTAENSVERMRQSVFNELFGDLQRFPMRQLSELAVVRSGLTKGRRIAPDAKTRAVPYMAVLNVQDRRLNLSQVKEVEATDPEIQKYRLRDGDLLLTEGGDPDKLGRGTVWRTELPESIHQNHIFCVRLHTDLVAPVVLNWVTSSNYGKHYFLRSAKQTTGIASINATQLKAFPVPLVPVDLQHEFLDNLAKIDRIADAAACSRNHLEALFVSLQSRAFRGEL